MPESPETSEPRIKVKRTRRRLYEEAPEGDVQDTVDPAPTTVPVAQTAKTSKRADAERIVRRYMIWSAGTALIPLPLVDMVAVTAIELALVKKLSDHYNIGFSSQRGKALIVSLIGGVHAGLFTGSFLKMVPVIGFGGAVIPIAALAGALTYAVGKVFIHHFEAGGTLLDFDPSKLEKYFEQKLKEGHQETVKRKATG
jgi:uncharacterized protein (DUF697 family)